jgi:hypothetical protein
MTLQRFPATLIAAAMLAACPVLAAAQDQGPDELWETTVKMEMAGMPMQMPEQTQRVCQQKGAKAEDTVPHENSCKVLDAKQVGNKSTFKLACDDGKNKYTGMGEVERSGDTTKGVIRMTGTMEGKPVDMTQSFSSRKVGGCKYEDLGKKYAEQHNQMMAKECAKAVDEMNWALISMDHSPCADRKPEFCKRVSAVTAGMRDPAGYSAGAQKNREWREWAKACGQDPQALTAEVCKKGVSGKDWNFVASHCTGEAKAIAAQQCAGRDYTAAMASEYAPICRRYAASPGRDYTAQPVDAAKAQPQQSAPVQTQGAQNPSQPQQKPSSGDQVKEGVNKLKKFLKF